MSGNRRGGQHKLVITKKSLQYPVDPGDPGNVKIEKESDVAAETPLPSQALQLKLGLRVKLAQTVELFEVRFKPGPDGLLPLHAQPVDDPIAQDLTATLGRAPDERWATFLADYDPAFGAKFKTTLRLSPFAVHDNGFQVITVAFTHANRTFARDNYVFGISLLPGKNNAGVQLNLGPGGGGAAAKKATKTPAKAAKARKPAKKSAKKAPRKSKGRARRNR
ncbi:MAG TPA: hypothetical protein VFR53_11430 [Methylomirabilota bacterium]|nr:hypothetical protein [Methylomirabilota bacterium]